MKSAMTAQGTILGTLQYMAPEQVEGKEVDARTDIFAFGAVVYEMATGKKAFEGKTQASVIAKILETDPPPMSSLQPMTPPALDRVVKKCLAKEPDERWQTASDLCGELKWIAEGGSQTIVANDCHREGRVRSPGAAGADLGLGIVCLVVARVTGLAIWNLKPSPPAAWSPASVITLPPGQQLVGLNSACCGPFSRRHSTRLCCQLRGGTQQLYLRAMDSLEARPIPGTEGASLPLLLSRRPMGRVFRRRKAEEGLGERGSER